MKNLSVCTVLLILIVLFFSACKKNDELSTKDKLMGVWYYDVVKNTQYENGQVVDTESYPVVRSSLEFKSDGTYNIIFEGGKENGTWDLVGQDKQILLGAEGSSSALKLSIQELTSKKLILLFEDSYIEEEVSYRYESELTLVKR